MALTEALIPIPRPISSQRHNPSALIVMSVEPPPSVNIDAENMTCSLALGPEVHMVEKKLEQLRNSLRILISDIKANYTETVIDSDSPPKMLHIDRDERWLALSSQDRGYGVILYYCSRPQVGKKYDRAGIPSSDGSF
jgi:hypothetical protein